jgi:hypothetical protein
MDARKLVLPAVALVGGAMLGRLVGFKGLVRVGMAAFTLANMTESAGLISAGRRASTGRAVKAAKRAPRKRSAPRKAAARKGHAKSASAPASAQTH